MSPCILHLVLIRSPGPHPQRPNTFMPPARLFPADPKRPDAPPRPLRQLDLMAGGMTVLSAACRLYRLSNSRPPCRLRPRLAWLPNHMPPHPGHPGLPLCSPPAHVHRRSSPHVAHPVLLVPSPRTCRSAESRTHRPMMLNIPLVRLPPSLIIIQTTKAIPWTPYGLTSRRARAPLRLPTLSWSWTCRSSVSLRALFPPRRAFLPPRQAFRLPPTGVPLRCPTPSRVRVLQACPPEAPRAFPSAMYATWLPDSRRWSLSRGKASSPNVPSRSHFICRTRSLRYVIITLYGRRPLRFLGSSNDGFGLGKVNEASGPFSSVPCVQISH